MLKYVKTQISFKFKISKGDNDKDEVVKNP